MLHLLAPLLFTLLAAPIPDAVQDDSPRGPTCNKCKSTGLIPCSKHTKRECEMEEGTIYCSVIADCEKCHGVARVDCPRCDNEAAQKDLASQIAAVARRGHKLQWIEDKWNEGRSVASEPLRKVESDHFELVWEMEGMKVDRKRLSSHETMHLYVDRLEQIFADYVEAFHTSPRDFKKKSTVLVWYLPNDQQESSLRFCSNGSKHGIKLLGATPRYSVCANRQFFKDDETLHRNIAHSVGHLLLSHQNPSAWIGDKKYGWADEGVAHWFEDRYFDLCTNYCYQEQNTRVGFKSGKYKVAVRKMVSTGKEPGVADVFSRTTQELTLPEHAIAFSYVDYLLTLDGEKFNKMMKMLRRKVPTRDALRECYELNPFQFETRWKEWVLGTYPSR
jgi:hypothetical protein